MRFSAPLLALLMFGCSAVNAPEAHLAEPVDATEFCEAYANVVCDGVIGCCSAAREFPRDECIARAGVLCTETLGPLISDPRSGYDDEEAGVQLAIGQLLVDECDPFFNRWLLRRDGLLSVLTGSVDEGGSCDPIFMENFTPGSLRIDSPRFVSCGVDLACRANAGFTAWNCLAPAGAGGGCIGLGDCDLDLTCVPTSDTAAACMARLPDGSTCTSDTSCDSYDCYCSGTPSTCRCRPDDMADQVYCGLAMR